MSKARKADVDLRHDLSADFVQSLASDWKENETRQEAKASHAEASR